MNTKYLAGAGVTLALVLNPVMASAQDARPAPAATPTPSAATSTSAPISTRAPRARWTAEDAAENRRIAEENGIPEWFLSVDRDRYGIQMQIPAMDTVRDLGVAGAKVKAEDDAMFCVGLTEIKAFEQTLRAADLAVKKADEEAAKAVSDAEKQAAEAKRKRARKNFFQLLLTGLKLGLVFLMPGGWVYGAYLLGSEASAFLDRNQHRVDMKTTDKMNAAFIAMSKANALRVKAHDMRNELYDMRGRLWDTRMGGWCKAMEKYHQTFYTADAKVTYGQSDDKPDPTVTYGSP